MKFTIVTPSYNKGPYLERTIQSVLAQAQPGVEIEYIIMDNFSTDETPGILERYERISWQGELKIIQYHDRGQADAINQGWAAGTGEIFAWLNADDVYLDHALVKVANFFQTHPEVMAVYGEAVYIDSHDRTLKPVTNIRDYSYWNLLSHDFITQPATFIHRNIFQEIGVLSQDYRYVFDWDYWIRVAQSYDFLRIPVLVAGYRITGDNLTTTGKGKRLKEMIHLVWKYGGLIHLVLFLSRLVRKYLVGDVEIPAVSPAEKPDHPR